MDLDERVSGVLFRMHKLERALHETGMWAVEWQGQRYPASRSISSRAVTIHAHLPGGDPRPTEAWLLVNGDPFERLCFTPPQDGQPFLISLVIEVEDPVAA